jgi:hypothetical protein
MTTNTSPAEFALGMPKNPLLTATPPTGLLQRPTAELAQATRPPHLANQHSPLQWSRHDWDRLEADRKDVFDMAAIQAQFDYDEFLTDGYAVLREVVLPATIEEWMAALQYGQQLNDALLRSDWSLIDWHGLGRPAPEKSLTAAEIENALGGSQRVPQSTDEAGVKTLRLHSVFAEYFSAGHVPFLMDLLLHPQMLQLQRMCLGCDDVYFDHNQLLTRPAGYPGGGWHSHQIGAGKDNCGNASLEEYQAQPNANLTLCYPQGFAADDDGGLKLIRGSHLCRDPAGCRAPNDDEMRQGWLQGRMHPVTGKPLQIEHLALPPGSIVCCLSHAVHGVARKTPDKQTRWCSLYCYKKADDRSGHVQPSAAVPPVWALKAQRGELPPTLAQLLRPSYDRQLTGGRTEEFQP